jgi:ELWxxDGT repeat protein
VPALCYTMNKAHVLLFALMMTTVSLAGCFGGDDGDSNDEKSSETIDKRLFHIAVTSSDLPECDNTTNEHLYYVEADSQFQVCTSSEWQVIDVTGPAEQDGTNEISGLNALTSSNNTMLTSLTSPSSTMGCNAGGKIISHGLDNGNGGGISANGVLESGEIDAAMTICSYYSYTMVKNINSVDRTIAGSNPQYLTAIGNTLYFQATDGTSGEELWKSDGTATGTVMLKDINGGDSSSPHHLTAVGNTLYFIANDGTNGEELWKSDGTTNGTVMVKDIKSGSGDGFTESLFHSYDLTAVGNTIYFRADDGTNGEELWKSDGTAAGTEMVNDINSGSGSSIPAYLTAIGNTLYFRADDGTNGHELWKSDGTASGTVMVKDINGGTGNIPYHLTAVGNTLYFSADDSTNGSELWKSDGTAAGTVMVKDINSGSGTSFPYDLTAVGNILYFQADDSTNGYELWKSDGTAAGTVMVKDIGSGNSRISTLTAVGNTLYFSADDGHNGSELWKSDGTAAGTVMVKNVNEGSRSSYPSILTAVGNTLYFSANEGIHGQELWKSDGTETGTVLVSGGITTGGWESLTTAGGNTFYFVGYDGTNGYELWTNLGVYTEVIYS